MNKLKLFKINVKVCRHIIATSNQVSIQYIFNKYCHPEKWWSKCPFEKAAPAASHCFRRPCLPGVLGNDIQLQKSGWMKKGAPPPGYIVIYCKLIIMTGCNCYYKYWYSNLKLNFCSLCSHYYFGFALMKAIIFNAHTAIKCFKRNVSNMCDLASDSAKFV
jgi:hypothetical protein